MFQMLAPPPTPPIPESESTPHEDADVHAQLAHLTRIAMRTETRLCKLIDRLGYHDIVSPTHKD